MGRAQREWAARKRTELVKQLGGVCVDCGSDHDLEFDVVIPLDEGGSKPRHHRKMSIDTRMRFYTQQAEAQNLKLRCSTCNGTKGSTHDKKLHTHRKHMNRTQAKADLREFLRNPRADNFNALLFLSMQKAGESQIERLKLAFPHHVQIWQEYQFSNVGLEFFELSQYA